MSLVGDIGPCIVQWNSETVATVHEDGARFRHSVETADVKEAMHGNAPVDSVIIGFGPAEFECPFTRITWADLARMMPGGSHSGVSGSGTLLVRSRVTGTTLYSLAQELIVKRIVGGIADTDASRWLHIPKAYPIPNFDIPYNLTDQRGFMVTFKAFPDADDSDLVWHVGQH